MPTIGHGIELYFADVNYSLVPSGKDSDSIHLAISGDAAASADQSSNPYKAGTIITILVALAILVIIFGLYMAARYRRK